jgi:hypothetical protein
MISLILCVIITQIEDYFPERQNIFLGGVPEGDEGARFLTAYWSKRSPAGNLLSTQQK